MKRTILCFLMAGLVPAALTRGEAELGLQLTPELTFVRVTGDKQKFREDSWLGNGFSGGIEEATRASLGGVAPGLGPRNLPGLCPSGLLTTGALIALSRK